MNILTQEISKCIGEEVKVRAPDNTHTEGHKRGTPRVTWPCTMKKDWNIVAKEALDLE